MEKIKKIKLIVTDLDGTLFHSDKTVSDAAVNAIYRVRDKGIKFTVNTGRSYAWLGGFVDLLGIDCPLVGSNGCEIVHGGTGERLYTASLSAENAAECIKFCMRHRLSFFSETPDGWLLPDYLQNMDNFPGFYPDLPQNGFSYDKIIPVHLETETNKFTTIKTVVWITYGNEGELLSKLVSHMPGTELIHSARDIYEILPAGVDKGTSFHMLCKIMGVAPDECCTLGDYDNDLPMLSASGLSVAMGNAPVHIKRLTDYVTDTNNNDGVAKAINKLFLS